MPSDRSPPARGGRPSRRRLLATLGAVTSASIAGCGGVFSNGGSDGSDGSGEVIVENGTSSGTEIAVRVVDGEGETLFGHVFALGPEEMVSRGGIEATPSRVRAFTAGGVSETWRYDPDLPAGFECEPKDIGLTLGRDDAIEPWYDC